LIIQRLFSVGLGLQGVLSQITQPEVVLKLSAFVDDLDATIRDVRKTIFSLQEPDDRASGLRGEILRTVTAAATVLQFEPLLTMAGPVDSAVPDKLRPELLAVIGEALTNVARHAKATQAEVRVRVDVPARTVVVVIQDDGIGFGADDVPGYGTVNMAARARQVDGTFTMQRGELGGAQLTWSAPLDPIA